MKNKGFCLEQIIERLNAEYEKGSWWQILVDRPGVFVGLQDDAVAAYWRGFLLLHITLVDGRLQVQAREKALCIHSSRCRVVLDKSATYAKTQTVQGLDGVARYLPQICKQAELLATPAQQLAGRIGSRLFGTLACHFEVKNKVVDLVTMCGEGKIRGLCIRPYASADLRGNRPRIQDVLRDLNRIWQREEEAIVRLFRNQILLWQSLRGRFFQVRRNIIQPVCLHPISLLITDFDSVQREHGLPELVSGLDGFGAICVGKPDNVSEKHLATAR